MPVHTSTRPLGTAGRDFHDVRDHHPTTCACCRRAEALANGHVEDIVQLEFALEQARGDTTAYQELLRAALDQLNSMTRRCRQQTQDIRDLRNELRQLRADDRWAA